MLKPFNRKEALEALRTNKAALLEYDSIGTNLRGADLRRADMRDADLRLADMRDADLRDADLRDADLRDTDLDGADLRGADLDGADLRGADLRRADLIGADLRGAELRRADLRGADLDFAAWPLWCGSLRAHVDDRILVQLLYHVLSLATHSPHISANIRTALLTPTLVEIANKFHRAAECGKLEAKSNETN